MRVADLRPSDRDPRTISASRFENLKRSLQQVREFLNARALLASQTGASIDPSNLLSRHHYPLLRRAGLPRLTFHALRHTAATLLLGSGTHIRVVAERLGMRTRA